MRGMGLEKDSLGYRVNLVALVFCFMGVVILFINCYQGYRDFHTEMSTWQHVVAQRSGFRKDTNLIYQVTYRWEIDGTSYDLVASYNSVSDIPPSKVIFVNPDNPEEYHEGAFGDDYVFPVCAGCVLLLIGIGWLRGTVLED